MPVYIVAKAMLFNFCQLLSCYMPVYIVTKAMLFNFYQLL